ncbi:hypothetical protein OIU84_017749 [Salix udensis]|uniref:Uncharacterized protein n=1 Tax=Salix udensis TaxID=889485 RepID=A0AAD6L2K2_9ROSI|nr:hypothetical protein OIU84_017749 [Salix udensis]
MQAFQLAKQANSRGEAGRTTAVTGLLVLGKDLQSEEEEAAEVSTPPTSTITTTSSSITTSSSSSSGMSDGYSHSSSIHQRDHLFEDAYKPDLSNCVEEIQKVWYYPRQVTWGFSEFDRMKVERQISASLYAINGVQECMDAVYDPIEALWDIPPP